MRPPHATCTSLGALRVGGDWACAHGDLDGLRHVAQQLAARFEVDLRTELEDLVTACSSDPDRAVALWDAVKTQLHGGRRSAAPVLAR